MLSKNYLNELEYSKQEIGVDCEYFTGSCAAIFNSAYYPALSPDFRHIHRYLHDGRLGGGGLKRTGYGGHRFRMPAYGHGNVVVANHLAGCGVESFPTGAGQINFRPGVSCTLAPRECRRVQVATDKARRQPQGAASLDKQGRKITA